MDFAHENGYTLVIALDCGIKSVDLITYALGLGIDFIVCDHHLPDSELPPGYCHPQPQTTRLPLSLQESRAAAGWLQTDLEALTEAWDLSPETPQYYLDRVATAIAADIVPVTGENRILAYYGLKRANESPSPGIKALIQLSGLEKTLHMGSLVFVIAPRVNAAGRMDDAPKGRPIVRRTGPRTSQGISGNAP